MFSFSVAFGSVIELRINTKGVGGKLPNFGFVVFDDSDPVQRILAAKVRIVYIYGFPHIADFNTYCLFCEICSRCIF